MAFRVIRSRRRVAGYFLPIVLVLAYISPAAGHLCGPATLEMSPSAIRLWTIKADRTESETRYTIIESGNPDVAVIQPRDWAVSPFYDHHGVFEIIAKQPGTTQFGVNWYYEPTGADVDCYVTVTVRDGETFSGFPHWLKGAVDMEANGDLTVSGFGDSGEDGFDIDLGQLRGGFKTDLSIPPGALVDGARGWATAYGRVNGIGDQPISTAEARVFELGGELTVGLKPDFSFVGASSYSVQYFNDGTEVFSDTGRTDEIAYYAPQVNLRAKCGPYEMLGETYMSLDLRDGPADVTDPASGITYQADRIRTISEGLSASVDYVSYMEVRGTHLGEMNITREMVQLDGLWQQPVGETVWDLQSFYTGLRNMSDTGEDGVRIRLGRTRDTFRLWLLPTDIHDDGQRLTSTVTGTVDGTRGSLIGTTELWYDSGLKASADYSSIGATDVSLDVFDNGSWVGGKRIGFGEAVDVAGPPPLTGISKLSPSPVVASCFAYQFAGDTEFSASGSSYFGDELRLTATSTTATINSLDWFELTTANLTYLDVAGQEIVPAECGDATHPYPAGDITMDCVTDYHDLAVLSGQWRRMDCAGPGFCDGADRDQDGDVDLGDAAEVVEGWLVCTGVECVF